MRIPEAMAVTIDRLRKDLNWTDNDLVTAVRSSEVVQSGLVKKHIMLGGYVTPMESAVDEMVDDTLGTASINNKLERAVFILRCIMQRCGELMKG